MNLKLQKFSRTVLLLSTSLFSTASWGQIFQQDFNSSNTVSSYVSSSNPNAGQFNSIGSSGSGMNVSITNGKLRFARTGNAGSYARTTDFSPTPTFVIYQFDLAISGNTASITNGATWQLGSGFGTSNSTESNASTHSRIGLNFTTTNGNFVLRDIGGSENSAVFSGEQKIFWVVNNSGASKTYMSPNNTVVSLANDRADLWVGNVKALENIAATTASQSITDFKFAFSAGNATVDIDNLVIYGETNLTTWDGSNWSEGVPNSNVNAIINGNYTTTSTTPGFIAKNITVKSGAALEITDTYAITGAEVVVEDGGNLIQRDGSTLTSSSFNVLRNSASVADKYVFWSSPVANQNMFTAYANGSSATAPAYVMTYDTATNLYPAVSNTDANFTVNAGKGYSVKVPAVNASVSFGGSAKVPNNGNVDVALSTASFGYNLIGNPYPSNINLTSFYNANNSLISPTMWFWDNTTGNVTTQNGNTAVNVGYATFNGPSGTWTEAPNTSGPGYNSAALNTIGAFAKIGQGFIVKATAAGSATFTNAIRSSNTAVTLNKNVNATEGKFWIKLTTSYGNTVTQAITYNQGASDSYDVYDSKAMGMGSDAFYSVVGTEKLVIQGRAPFHVNDIVPLGNKHFENGNFAISLSHKEGLFTNGQEIYLHDKQLGTYTNLQTGAYNFSANAGDFTNRFEIVYKLNFLSTTETEKRNFEVYRDGEDFVVRNHKNIQAVEIFDAAGRKIQEIKSNSKSVNVKIQTKGMYILKAVSEGQEYSQKIIK
ncbi:T9SS type A sorting domain-containing protein [Chryseobacterium sp. GP-SGM7]|uniref:T9SS type A sorting domain-containing protein n=1 Tax=Chryseobacterium sp. GP-SGM7 TaxID=3411323 RepID=UPI003B94B2BF